MSSEIIEEEKSAALQLPEFPSSPIKKIASIKSGLISPLKEVTEEIEEEEKIPVKSPIIISQSQLSTAMSSPEKKLIKDYNEIMRQLKLTREGNISKSNEVGIAKFNKILDDYDISVKDLPTENLPGKKYSMKDWHLAKKKGDMRLQISDFSDWLNKYINNIKKKALVKATAESKTKVEGSGNKSKGLWNDEIDNIMKHTPNYMGAVGLEDLPKIFKHISDNKLKKFSFILNTNTDHWVAVNSDGHSIEFYDPLTEWKPSKQFYNDFQKHIQHFPYMLKFKINNVKQQSDNTANCGWFCMRFLMERANDISFKNATDYPKHIKDNEKDIKNMKKLVGFGYI